jgi:Domain of unknown function (DUF4253)/Ankyrin repeats (3 copies)
VMLAAQGGHAEAFHALVQAGANLHALAFRQVDLLEMAARGGNVEIVRCLLERGLPVDGHWQPHVEALRKRGHETPLIQAAANGQVASVRVLLEAGANRNAQYEGKTALQQVKECLHDPDYADLKQPYLEIAALLGEVSADRPPPEDPAAREVEKFAQNARQPAYRCIRQMLTELCGPGRPWQPIPDHGIAAPDVVAFTLRECKKPKTLDDLQEEVRNAGGHLVLSEPWLPGANAQLVLFPTNNKLAVVTATGTEGANYRVPLADIIVWLRNLDKENPFALCYCGHDLVGGAFLGRVKAAKKLAERMVELCPSVLDEGFASPATLARVLSKNRTFLLRWD